jgi:hypothetical protein
MHNVFVRHTPRVLLSVIYVQRPHCKFPPPPRAPHGTPSLGAPRQTESAWTFSKLFDFFAILSPEDSVFVVRVETAQLVVMVMLLCVK